MDRILCGLTAILIACGAGLQGAGAKPGPSGGGVGTSGDTTGSCVAAANVTGPELERLREAMLDPGATIDLRALMTDPALLAYQSSEARRARSDWPNLCRYRAANLALRGAPRPALVLVGDSITENWAFADPKLLDGTRVVGRGISGQTSQQILLRFYADVIALQPKSVHIMVGTNDVAGNTGPISDVDFENNVRAMAELAKAHNIRILIAGIPPSKAFPWAPQVSPASRIERLNVWLRRYAREIGATYVDYDSVLSDGGGGMRADLANDGVHPNRAGYAAMGHVLESELEGR